MEKKRPKRRKDKYNPYRIYENENGYYISFRDGEGIPQEMQISRELFDAFDCFELEDISYLNKWDRHIEHSELMEQTLNERAMNKAENVEDAILRQEQIEELRGSIGKLTEVQRRRLLMYFFGDMTFEEIGKLEGCKKASVKESVDSALIKIKKNMI